MVTILLCQAYMAYFITKSCLGVCDTGCVDVCPCDCIQGPVDPATLRLLDESERKSKHPDARMFIDPDVCIDCGACMPECPVEAILPDVEAGPEHREDLDENAAFFGRGRSN